MHRCVPTGLGCSFVTVFSRPMSSSSRLPRRIRGPRDREEERGEQQQRRQQRERGEKRLARYVAENVRLKIYAGASISFVMNFSSDLRYERRECACFNTIFLMKNQKYLLVVSFVRD